MDNLIWLYALLLIIFALVVIGFSFTRKGESGTGGRREQNIAITKHQIAELKADFNAGHIDATTFETAKQEQEDALHRDLEDEDEAISSTSIKDSRLGIAVIALFIPVFSVFMYMQYGKPTAIFQSAIDPRSPTQQQQTSSLESVVGTLEKKLDKDPSAKGYMMLGRSYAIIKQPKKAVGAYRKGLKVDANHAEIKFSLADVLATMTNNTLTGEPEKLILEGLKVKPKSIKGLWLAGMAARQRNDKVAAIGYWKKVSSLLPKDSKDYKELAGLIAETEGKPLAVATEVKPQPTSGGGVTLTVAVNIAPEIQAKLSPEQVVFIYAKATSGPPMPLAAVRKQVKDLPITVQLTDAMAMMPQFKLSSFKEYHIGARISMSGTPTKQPGDIVASSVLASQTETNITLSLDTIVQ
ncbi:MAG: c-type cytochrome biogenesis protein CcmI [Thiotrichaceae bacterium]|nr:c-type cytochrome biogenesis protein CcmI [Thiotrichaceae bacterium]